MPRNPSTGVYSKPAGTTPSVGQVIDPVPWNALTTDLGNEITNSLPRDGSAPMVAPLKAAGGTVSAPGIGFASTPQTGLYLKGGGLLGFTQNGVDVAFDKGMVYVAKSGDYTALASDDNAVHRFTAAATLTLTAAATLGANWHYAVIADGGDVTIDPNGSETIDGAASLVVPNGYSAFIICSGSAFFTDRMASTLKTVAASAPAGHIYGLTLSNNAGDPTNSIDIAAGAAASDGTTPVLMSLASTLIKVGNVEWAVGSGNGWLDTVAIADGWYYPYIIARSDTGVVDSLLSASATSPTMPGSYDRKRRIGALLRVSGAWVSFVQDGDFFAYKVPTTDVSTIATSAALRTLKVPPAFPVMARIVAQIANTGGAIANINHWDPTLGTSLPSAATGFGQNFVNNPVSQAFSREMDIRTNSAGQIYNVASSTSFNFYTISTQAYFDTRGRFN
ncbi:hypothetical protein RWK44_31885 [Rhizobium sp. 25PS6]|uniref:hypothetical protein n=1 Tax=Rhizobium sp. 25PS6 TaxID=3075622 RepID=UPI0028FD4BAE|nr:hypothetical protein [Rhizobium sp. 25PS6]MDU0364977.1 hypothetical protein [Rhizobium sp. 25PS6]